jgi:hypothetical protein
MTVTKPNQRTCAYPGCTVVLDPDPELGGRAPGYCSNPKHNAYSAYTELKRQGEATPGMETLKRRSHDA